MLSKPLLLALFPFHPCFVAASVWLTGIGSGLRGKLGEPPGGAIQDKGLILHTVWECSRCIYRFNLMSSRTGPSLLCDPVQEMTGIGQQ